MNLGYNVVSGVVAAGTGTGLSALSSLTNRLLSGNSHAMRFYWNKDLGGGDGGVVKVLAGQVAYSAASAANDYAIDQLEKLLYKKEREQLLQQHKSSNFTTLIENGVANEEGKYGSIDTRGGTVIACDIYGNKCFDALMLKIPTKKTRVYQYRPNSDSNDTSSVSTTDLVWWDCTAIITINSEKNLILTRVQGRDHTRKELVANGDINFSVTGHILSAVPDIYPHEEVQKFTEVMQYKGWVYVNNEVLDQFKIEKIVIKDFNINHQEGNKAHVTYTFNAVGVMPETAVEASGKANDLLDNYASFKYEKTESAWKQLLNKQVEVLKGAAIDTAKNVTSTSASIINNMLE